VTTLIYATHLALLLYAFWRIGPKPIMWIIIASMVCSWIIAYRLGGIDRITSMIILDLALILSVRALCEGARARLVAAVSLALIVLRAAYMTIPYMGHSIYASIVNFAFVLQLLIGGGMVDDVGRWIDSRVSRLWPRGARALRNVAT